MEEKVKKDVVLVTGSSGCLGQHIVKQLQERDDDVSEIRLFDLRKYENNLGHEMNKKMVEFIGDICHPEEFHKACQGVDVIIHCAASIQINLWANFRHMECMNVFGTARILEACTKFNIPRLIYASSTAMVCGTEHIFFGTESTTPIPKTWMIGPYGETICKAEELILDANGYVCDDGVTKLRTVSLRPTPFFGEEDRHFFVRFMKFAKQTKDEYYKIRSLDERMQISYVGNVAWAFLKAKQKLKVDETIGGEAFFITDDTPIIDIHEHARPYLLERGLMISDYTVPYWLAWILLTVFLLFIRLFNCCFRRIDNWDIPSINMLNYLCSTFFYNRSKATLRLDYEPIFPPSEARCKSLDYYKTCNIFYP